MTAGRLQVVQIIDSLSTGGAERLLPVLASRAAELGVDVEVISLGGAADTAVADQLVDASIPVTFVGSERSQELLDGARRARLVDVLAARRPDVVHLHLDMSIMVGGPAARALDIPTVATLHNTTNDLGRLASLKQVVFRRALRRTDQLIAVGPTVADRWASRVPGVPLAVVPNPVAAVPDRGVRPVTDRTPPIVLSVGRLMPQKSYPVLLEAMRRVIDANRVVRCRIAGEGPERGRLEAMIEELDLGRSVELLGLRSDVDELLAAADVFASSASWEGMPLSVLEAMAAGLPIVATDVGDVASAVPAEAGLLVPPHSPERLAEALLALLADPERRRRAGAAARRHVAEHHHPGRWAERIAGIYADLVGRRSAPGATA